MIPFPSIEQFNHVRRNVQIKTEFVCLDEQGEPVVDRLAVMPKLLYEGTTKIHGTNGSFVVDPYGKITTQSRERVITPDNDNYGFSRFIHSLPLEDIGVIFSNFPEVGDGFVVYGEWAGPGIQQNVAISQIQKRSFFVFAVKHIINGEPEEKERWLDIRHWKMPNEANVYNIYQFFTHRILIDFEHPEEQLAEINRMVESVEQKCPVGFHFGINGIGEGLVYRPLEPEWNHSKYIFKAKGNLHSKSHVKKLATVDIEKFKNGQEFVAKFLDEERLQQGIKWLKDNNKPFDVKSTGDFLRFIVTDIIKETIPEREESGISDNEVGKLVNVEAKRWFFRNLGL